MKLTTKVAEYTMEREENSFKFSVKEENDFSSVRINYITPLGARLFFTEIVRFDVRACQLVAVAEDKAAEAVTEIFPELL